jgi:hypothetical protein
MKRTGKGERSRPRDKVAPVPESQPAPPRLDLRSAPYPLTHTYTPGVHFPLRGLREAQRGRRINHDASSL